MLKASVQTIGYGLFVVLAAVLTMDSCNRNQPDQQPELLRSLIPSGIKDTVYLSPANPFGREKAALGRYFFYDRRLSINQSKSCASCHDPAFSFTDSYRRSIGIFGENVQHNAPALINIIFNPYLSAADSSLHFPEQQVHGPMFHQQPVEMGWKDKETLIIARLKKDSLYAHRMAALFADSTDPFSLQNIQDCITSFVKTLLSFNSPYDRYLYKKDSLALSAAQQRGMALFFSKQLACSQCHAGVNFSRPLRRDSMGDIGYYQNTGLYNVDGKGSYPADDQGLIEYTHQRQDMGKFRVPGLRNLAFTAPYLHNGSAASLREVIDIYAAGGRKTINGSPVGDGPENPYKSPLLQGFVLNNSQKNDLVDFLLSLSDSSFCQRPEFSNPFFGDETRR